MGRGLFESFLALVVLAVAARFVIMAWEVGGPKDIDGYSVDAVFVDLGNLEVGTDVVVGGIPVGEVTGMSLDSEFGLATAHLSIDGRYSIPVDSTVRLTSYGLLSPSVLLIGIGQSRELVEPGGTLRETRDVVTIEDELGRQMHGSVGGL